MQLSPILAVKDVSRSSNWYQSVCGFAEQHGGDEFSVLATRSGDVILCLHKWGVHAHPTLTHRGIDPSTGLILYFRTRELDVLYERANERCCRIESEIEINPNSKCREFSMRDLDGYFLTFSEHHDFK